MSVQRSRGFGGTAPYSGTGAGHALDQISILAAGRTPADVQRDTAPAGAAPGDIQTQVEAALQQSDLGRDALQTSKSLKVQMVFQAGGPNQYRPRLNVCYLNSSLPPGDVAAYFVHEMNHALKHSQDPAHDDATKNTEDAFVKQMVQEEIDGTVLAIESRLDVAGAGGLPSEKEYRSAYEFARKEALGNGADVPTSVEAGKQRGRKMVSYLIRPTDGSWPRLAPSQFESYEMYYRREWRQENKPKAP